MTVQNIVLHGGPHDGLVVREPEGCRLLFPFFVAPPLYFVDKDEPIPMTGFAQIAYERVVQRCPQTRLPYTRWEYVTPADPQLREAVERHMALKASEPRWPAHEEWEASRKGTVMVALLDDVIAAKRRTCESVPFPVAPGRAEEWDWAKARDEFHQFVHHGISINPDVLESTRRADHPMTRDEQILLYVLAQPDSGFHLTAAGKRDYEAMMAAGFKPTDAEIEAVRKQLAKFGDYELTCYTCAGKDFVRRLNLNMKDRIGAATTAQRKKDGTSMHMKRGWALFFMCKLCEERRAFVYFKEAGILRVRRCLPGGAKSSLGADQLVELSIADANELRHFIRETAKRMVAGAKTFIMRHGYHPEKFSCLTNVTAATAKQFLRSAEKQIIAQDAATEGLTRLELEYRRRAEAMRFYRSIVQDPFLWEKAPKLVMLARRELSALEGIACDTGQVNVNVTNSTPQITVYQLAIPDDGRTRQQLPTPPAQEVIECQPNPKTT